MPKLDLESDKDIIERITNYVMDDGNKYAFNNELCKYGLYETYWTGYQKVIKRIDNDCTILIKTNDKWKWYNNDIKPEYIKILTDLLMTE